MGTIPATGYESSVVQTFSSPTGTSHTMTYAANVSDMVLVINNVIQEPTVAYTTSGTTLTTATLVSGDTMYIIYLALSRNTVAPGSSTVTNAMMVDDSINSAEIVAGAVDLAHMSSQSVDEDNLHISNAGSNGQFLSKQSGNTGGLTWAAATHTGNVAFPATQVASADANTLDDYEEGTWTATLSDSNSDAGMATTTGVYTKIGRMVYCEIQMRNNNLTGITSTVRISGLPFTSANDGVYPALSCGHMNSAALAAATGYIHGFINPNTTYIELRINDETDGGSGLLGTEWDTDGQFFGSIFYHST